ncbi:MAG: hypothetical protein KJ583_00800 [Nanoarchaeota archaeon]|nr:hypothetical protein [Nanoarchaeota archaeon]MBU1269356.1 hypothetical protein [Nanoarchaeota archaeon]MBU1603828.1 hypothetical protein [Nanoarchaeota archaeon]MBU2443020.1 hypothetical protein [Nanoarchaeota archaeon]
MTKVYCDTCVYRDAFEGESRRDRLRPLDEFAWNFFNKVMEGKFILVTSDWVFHEFKKTVGNTKDLDDLLSQIEDSNKIHVTKTKEDIRKANELSKTNFDDALHVVLAKKAGAFILTTQNIKHFAEFKDLIEIVPPEKL